MKTMGWVGVLLAACSSEVAPPVASESPTTREIVGEVDLPRGSSQPIHVAPDGAWWIGARHGHLWVSRDEGGSWEEVPTPAEKARPRYGSGGEDLGLVRFFDAKVGMIPVNARENSPSHFRTTDGGRTWTPGEYAGSFTPRDFQVREDGSAWIVGSLGHVITSTDAWESWTWKTRAFKRSSAANCVHFVSAERGLVGGSDNELALTEGGGETWTLLATPKGELDPDFSSGGVRHFSFPVDDVLMFGDRFVVRQQIEKRETRTFHRLSSESEWHRLTLDESEVLEAVLHPEGLVVRTAKNDLFLLDEGMEVKRVLARELSVRPYFRRSGGISVAGHSVLVFDGRSTVAVVDEDGVELRPLRTLGEYARWNLRCLDRAPDGTLWGTTASALYRSDDNATTWIRATPIANGAGDLAIQSKGDVLLWGLGEVERWSLANQELQPVEVLDGFWKCGLQRRGDLWIAFGSRILDEDRALLELRTPHSYWGGAWLVGEILVSTDGGESWNSVCDWPDGRIEDVWLGEELDLAAYHAGGGLRRGKLDLSVAGQPQWRFEELVEPAPHKFPSGYNTRIYFDGEEGVVSGEQWYGGTFRYRSTDGGRAWSRVFDSEPIPDLRLGSGEQVDIDKGYVSIIREGEFEELVQLDWSVYRTKLDAGGGMLVDFENGALMRLLPDGSKWETLRMPH